MTPEPEDLPPDAVPGLLDYSSSEQGRRFRLPPGFLDRLTASALHQRKRRVQRQWAVGLSLAASVLAVVGLSLSGAFTNARAPEIVEKPKAVPPPPLGQPQPTPNVRDQLASAGAALETLTWRTTEQAVGPTRTLLDSAARATGTVAPPRPLPPAPADDPTLALSALPDAARASLDPMTSTTRRAMNRLLKDVGLRAN